MNMPPKLSVIIPTYNRAAFLRRTLESVVAQTFSDYEVIVVDDGSTDCTEDVVAQFLNGLPGVGERLRYIFQPNQGKSVAVNRGLSEARGEWIAFLDSDDLWLPNKIEEQFKALRQYAPQSQASFTDARFINNPHFQGTLFDHAAKRYATTTGLLSSPIELIGKFWVSMVTILVHSRVMAKVGEFDPSFRVSEDEDFVFRLSLHTRLCYVNSPLVLIDRMPKHRESLTESAIPHVYESLQLRQRRYEKWLQLTEGLGGDIQAVLRNHLCGARSEQTNWLLINKKYDEARRAAALAARTQCRPGIMAKWCLATLAPGLARRVVARRSRRDNRHKMESTPLHACPEDGGRIPAPEGLE